MSDWEKVERFIREHNYIPKNVSWESYIASVLLHLDGFSEQEEREIKVDEFLDTFFEYGTFTDYDYE